MRIVRTRRGARLVQDDVTLSEILARPGPTHTMFDVLAAAVAALAPERGARVSCAVLGFAGGGMIAPLRAMGFDAPVAAVDLSREAEPLFRELSDAWAGEVTLDEEDAVAWLRRRRTIWDVIVEDLSTPSPAGVVKPYVSFDPLPELIAARLAPERGVAVTNLLPLPGTAWDALQARVTRHARHASVVHLDEYENRLVIAGPAVPDAREISRRLRTALRAIESDQAQRLSVRTLVRG